jgi:hypothetical protein
LCRAGWSELQVLAVADISVSPLVSCSDEGSEGGSGDRVSPKVSALQSPLSRWLVVARGGGVVGVVLVAIAVVVAVRRRARRRQHAAAVGGARDKSRAVTASRLRDGDGDGAGANGHGVHGAASGCGASAATLLDGDGGVTAPGDVVMYRLSDVLEGSTGNSWRGVDASASAVVDAAGLARNDASAFDGVQVDLDRVRVARERLRSPVTVKRSDSPASSENFLSRT